MYVLPSAAAASSEGLASSAAHVGGVLAPEGGTPCKVQGFAAVQRAAQGAGFSPASQTLFEFAWEVFSMIIVPRRDGWM